jgi:formylglycine-generating enzyme required for sulfatase activity
MDREEVTRADYSTFLAQYDPKSPPPLSPACAAHGSLEPDSKCDADALNGVVAATPDARKNAPITCVDWCDAQTYCRWAGKDLCSGVYSAPDDPAQSMWYAACSSNDTNEYGYGSYKASTCKDADSSDCNSQGMCLGQVGTYPGCKTSEGIFDLSGNAAEWVGECLDDSGPQSKCLVRGGSASDPPTSTKCAYSVDFPRQATNKTLGFRCCYQPP